MCFKVLKEGNISMMVICYASDVIECDRRKSELSDAPLHMKQYTNSIEKKTDRRFNLRLRLRLRPAYLHQTRSQVVIRT